MWCSILGYIVTLILGLLATPLAAEAQPVAKVPRIGVLANNSLASASVHYLEPFRQGLRDLGYVEGQNIVVEYRFAEWQEDRLPALAAELVQLPVEILVTVATPATRVARQATSTIPIVFMIVNDPVGQGFVASLAQPGGNVTGLSTLSSEISGKRLELLQEAVPGLRRVAVFWNAANPGMALQFREAQAAAQGLGLPSTRWRCAAPTSATGPSRPPWRRTPKGWWYWRGHLCAPTHRLWTSRPCTGSRPSTPSPSSSRWGAS